LGESNLRLVRLSFDWGGGLDRVPIGAAVLKQHSSHQKWGGYTAFYTEKIGGVKVLWCKWKGMDSSHVCQGSGQEGRGFEGT